MEAVCFWREWNLHKQLVLVCLVAAAVLGCIIVTNIVITEKGLAINIADAEQAPSLEYVFGTDWLGRDMFTRTMIGLKNSLVVGLLASFLSVVIAFLLAFTSIFNSRRLDSVLNLAIDLCLGVPHLVLMVMISAAMGGGKTAVVVAVALTHWPSLTRLIRAEILQLRNEHYIGVARKMGKSPLFITVRHILPHLLPVIMVQAVLLFPHAILHEAAVTFLGFGLSPMMPAIGVILSESTRYIAMGMWWLVVFPGLTLLMMVMSFEAIGDSLRILLDPNRTQH
ncbi:MAG: ABC transporter permease [Deltaproteobacteria bacterium]|jgi:peptide/nickel transport system permease protein|nr:ABC transporter permease [Deltaproteobacteria bacterium]